MHIGTAGWSISREVASVFPATGHHLQRYAKVLNCAEINSSFYRRHDRKVYERWAAETPPADVEGLGDRLAVLLVQLPPSFAFQARQVRSFFNVLAELFNGAVVCEPRHESWFKPSADAMLETLQVARAAADPTRWLEGSQPGGWLGPKGNGSGALLYHRWHGSPKMYWSRYESQWLEERAQDLSKWPSGADRWCIFDNTAAGGAILNALEMQSRYRV